MTFEELLKQLQDNDPNLTELPYKVTRDSSYYSSTKDTLSLEELRQLCIALAENTYIAASGVGFSYPLGHWLQDIKRQMLGPFEKDTSFDSSSGEEFWRRATGSEKKKPDENALFLKYIKRGILPSEDKLERFNNWKDNEYSNYLKAKSYFDFIEFIIKRNSQPKIIQEKRDFLVKLNEFQTTSDKPTRIFSHLWDGLDKFSVTPITFLAELGKTVFSETIGLQRLHRYLGDNVGKEVYDVTLPTISVGYRGGYLDWSYIRRTVHQMMYGEEHVAANQVSIGSLRYVGTYASAPLVPWNYFFRNLGKVVGAAVGFVVGLIVSPVSLGRGVYTFVKEKIDIKDKITETNSEIALETKKQEDIESKVDVQLEKLLGDKDLYQNYLKSTFGVDYDKNLESVFKQFSTLVYNYKEQDNAVKLKMLIHATFQFFSQIKEGHNDYKNAMFYCGMILDEHCEDIKEARDYLQKAHDAGHHDAVIFLNLAKKKLEGTNLEMKDYRQDKKDDKATAPTEAPKEKEEKSPEKAPSFAPIHSGSYGTSSKKEPVVEERKPLLSHSETYSNYLSLR